MKRITAMLMAMAFAAVSLTGCSNSSTSSDNVSEISSEQESFVTTSSTTAPEDTSSETEKEIIHKTAPTMGELLIGIANAIGSHNEEEYNTYISASSRTDKNKSYKAIHKKFVAALKAAGLDTEKTYTYKDFTFFKYDAAPDYSYEFFLNEATDTIRFDMGKFSYGYNDETGEYVISSIDFTPIKGRYERALASAELLDMSIFETEVSE